MVYHIGTGYQIIFILLNMIIMLNMVIAILTSIFNKYEKQKQALYQNMINSAFSYMDFDDSYGALLCGRPPMNLISLPFAPLFSVIKNKELLESLNKLVCFFLYIPSAIIFNILFLVLNIFFLPLSYLTNLALLIYRFSFFGEKRVSDQLVLLLKHILVSPCYLLCSLPMN